VHHLEERLDPRGLDAVSFLKNKQLLAFHDHSLPVGQVEELDIQEDGVKFLGLTLAQQEIRSLILQDILKTVSVGFIPKKIQAPVFGDNGDLEEELVILLWELLELSIVSVPANQDSVFEVRGYEKTSKDANILNKGLDIEGKELAEILLLLKQDSDNTEIRTLIFDEEIFTVEEAKGWAKEHDFKSSKVDDTKENVRLSQQEPDLFKPDSFRTIELDEGVKAVIGKKKKVKEDNTKKVKEDNTKKENEEDASENDDAKLSDIVTLLQTLGSTLKRNLEVSEAILKQMDENKLGEDEDDDDDEDDDEDEGSVHEDDEDDEDKTGDEDEDEDEIDEDEDDDKKSKKSKKSSKSKNDFDDRFKKIEESIEKMTAVVISLVQKTNAEFI